MNYTPEQFAELSQWERNFTTAVEGNWTPRLSIPSQKRIRAIYEAATKTRIAFNIGCGHCVLNLLKQAGKLYFADKKEIEAQKVEEKPVESVQKLDSTDAKPKAKKSTASKPKGEKTATSAKPKTSKKEKEKV